MSATNDLPAGLNENPLLKTGGLPRFDLIKPEHVIPAVQQCLARAEQQLTELEANVQPTWAACFAKLEVIDQPFEYAWEPVSHLFGVLSSDELRAAYEAVLDDVVKFGLRASQSQPLYQACLGIRDGAAWSMLNAAQRRIVTKRIQSAELAGIGLQGEPRERFNAIISELSQIKTKYSNNVLDATKAFELIVTDSADVQGLPASLLAMAAQSFNASRKDEPNAPEASADGSQDKTDESIAATPENGPWRFTLDNPSFTPFMQHCRRRELRETMYRAFVTKASSGEFDNTDIMHRILRLRNEKANLLGFKTYADLSLASKMAPSVAAVEAMFETLRTASWDGAVRDFDEVNALAAKHGQTEPVMHWDVGFWAERLREQRFDFTDEQLRPYFPLERALDGMFALVKKIFGLQVVAKTDVPVWHADARYFEVRNEAGEPIAGFYLDPYCRPESKRPGAWMSSCLGRRRINGQLQLPVAHLVCNSTPPVGDQPSLMTFRELETLFHEFGHGLQHMLTVIDDADAAGINGVEWDAVELPSQFMENWCYHRPTLLGIAKHFETGETLPDELFEKLTAARNFRAASMMLRQLTFGMTDIQLHSGFVPPEAGQPGEPNQSGETVIDVQRRVAQLTSILQPLPEDRSLCTFSHIFAGGYSAGYYSYKWAEVLSADAWGAFEEAGLDNEAAIETVGRRFRDTVLELGGSQHPMDVFRAFRGREPDPMSLLRQNGLA